MTTVGEVASVHYDAARPASATRTRWIVAAIAALAAVYLLQLESPLRIDSDSTSTLGFALQLADNGLDAGAGHIALYQKTVATMYRAGLQSTQWLLFLNFGFLAIGLASVAWIARNQHSWIRLGAVAMTLLSFPIVRIAIMPNADAMGFGLSMLTIALLTCVSSGRTARNALFLLAATVLVAVATSVRMANVILAVPVIYCAIRILSPRNRRELSIVLTGLFLVIVGLIIFVGTSSTRTFQFYEEEINGALEKRSLLTLPLYRFRAMMNGFSELSVNLPIHRYRALRHFIWIIGVVPAVFFFRTARRAVWHPAVTVFVVSTLVMLTLWPFYTTRLWVPLIPLLMLHVLTVLSTLSRNSRTFAGIRVWAVWLCITGAVCLSYVSWVSLSGEKFMTRWGTNGGLSSPGHGGPEHDARVREIVQRFDGDHVAWRQLLHPER